MKSLYFHDQELSVIRINGELWLRGGQIGHALGFTDPNRAIARLFKRNKKEFTADMTTAIEVPTAGGVQLARIFNARGAALLAMLAKTDKAADFRAWVLDVLEGEQNKLPSQRVGFLQKELLSAKPRWKKILYYKEKGLRNFEIYRILQISKATLRLELRKMEACGLIEPPADLPRLQQLALPLISHKAEHTPFPSETPLSRGEGNGLLLVEEA